MKDYRKLIESESTAKEIFDNISEAKTQPQDTPVENDYLRVLEPQNGFERGDIVKVLSVKDTSKLENMDSFELQVEGKTGTKGKLVFDRSDADRKFQFAYDG